MRRQIIPAAALTALFLWSYWPTLAELVGVWSREPDYSHGFFVVPAAIYFLWARRDRLPALTPGIHWAGLLLLAVGVAMRFVGAQYYLDALDGWSIMFWLGGVVWLFYGPAVLRWCLPSIIFLWFMVRLPYRAELGLSLPLQTVATNLSCWVLQVLGQPALAEGHTIVLGDHTMEVEQACSGLRIFVGIAALAFAYIVIVRRQWWEKVLLLLSAIPIAIVANATRVVATALLFQYAEGETAKKFSHDAAGWLMIPFAAALFALVLWYVGRTWQEVERVEVGATIRRSKK
ncbi:MAG: exosortase/archaeosortase family protein [Thermoguttaceae bacterium]